MSLHLLPIALGDISPSPTNPRRTFDPDYINELAEDIKARGVLSPVLVRPHPIDGYELVFGECRWRAAQKAGLEVIPAMVRELSDAEVLEIQIIENAKRRDVHPLEEADAYRALHEQHEYSIDDIAAKLGKSKSYVYQRIRLCALAPTVREMFFAGRIKPAVALMLARIEDPEIQAEAAEDVADRPWSTKDLWEHIQCRFLHRLAQAPFDIEDASLVEGAGSCAKCPHRTGNQRDLFDEVGDLDSCTKPACWKEKADADWAKRSKGAKVLSDDEVEKHIPYGNLAWSAPYVSLDGETRVGDEYKTWREILEGTEHEVILARTTSGKVFELVSKEAAEAALSKLDVSPKPKTPEQKRKAKEAEERREKEEAERRAQEEAFNARVESLVARVEKVGPTVGILRAIVRDYDFFYLDRAKRRRGLDNDVFEGELAVMNDAELVGLLVELAIVHADDCVTDEDEDPFAPFEAALEAAPKGRRNLKKRETK